MKERTVALVAPNTQGSYRFSGKRRETLALGCLGAFLTQHDIRTELIDARLDNLTPQEVAEELIRLQPLLIGLTFMEQEPALWASGVIGLIREELPSTHITAGGYFPTLDPEKCFEILPELDSIVQGEGEETLLDLTSQVSKQKDWQDTEGVAFKISQGLIINPRRKLIEDLDALPEPIRYAREGQVSKPTIEGSRGCLMRCTFCSIGPHLDPKRSSWRGKSPQGIAGELVGIRKIYPSTGEYRFADADLVGQGANHPRLLELAKELLKAGFSSSNSRFFAEAQSMNVLAVPVNTWKLLHQAGFYQIFIGVETGSREKKKCLSKPSTFAQDLEAIDRLKSLGFRVPYGLIMIYPESDMDNVWSGVETLRQLGDADLGKYFSELILTPGTPAFEAVSQKGEIYTEWIDGRERYLYPLPDPVGNLRQIGRLMVEDPFYRSFLKNNVSLYSQINAFSQNKGKEATAKLTSDLDQINLDIFLVIVRRIQQGPGVLADTQIAKLLSEIIPTFEPRLSALENQLS